MSSINDIFEAKKDNPPLDKDEPPVAGSIRWVQALFYRIKQTILPFMDVPEIKNSEQFQAVSTVGATSHRSLVRLRLIGGI